MYQIAVRIIGRYAPVLTFPVAVVLGFIGYSIESQISSKKTPYLDKSISEERENRILNEGSQPVTSQYSSIFDKNNASDLKNK